MARSRTASPFWVSSSRGRSSSVPKIAVSDFSHGLLNYLEPQVIPRGAAADSLNWLTQGSKIEIRNGYALFGATRNVGGSISGLFTAHKWDGTEITYRARGQKIEYYSTATADWVEVGSNLLGSSAASDDVSFAEYFSQAGAQLWISSPNSGLWKILTANPGNAVSHYVSGTNYKGYIKITLNRMFAWAMLTTKTTVFQSKVDPVSYTTVTDESWGSGDGTTKTFTGTAAALSGKRTVFAIAQGTGNPETWTDNYLGVLTGSAGGTGTINYATGAYSVTFNTAPGLGVSLKFSYQWEDATSGGIADFTKSSPRLTGEGNYYLQAEGGAVLYSHTFAQTEYVMHERSAWNIVSNVADTATGWANTVFMKNISTQNWRGSVATQTGIYYVDTTIQSRPYFAVLRYEAISNQVLPVDLSGGSGINARGDKKEPKLNLTKYKFDKAAMIEWDRFIVCACRTSDSSKNNRIILYNKNLNTFDVVDFYASCFAVNNGTLLAGDPVTGNVFTLFSGFDDDGASPYATWTSNIDFLKIPGLKTVKQLWLEGEIDPNQVLQVWASIDRGAFVLVGTLLGNASYVDKNSFVSVGQNVMGQNIVGGGTSNPNLITSSHFEHKIKFPIGRFQQVQLKFIATGIGYVSVSTYLFYDVNEKWDRIPVKYN